MDLSIALFLGWILTWLSLDIVNGKNGYEAKFPAGHSAERILIKHLLASYEKSGGKFGRPVANHTHIVPVWFRLQLIQIVDLDEKNQVLKLNLWTNYKWIDEFLRWDPDDYQGVKEIRIPSDQIWTPDIKLYNYADTRLQERRDALCIVSHDGNISWIPQGIYMSTCNIDVTTFPFDKQNCSMKFGSWTHGGSRLNLNFLDGDNKMLTDDYFVANKAWVVLEAPGQRNTYKYACCEEQFEDLTYTLIFRRSATNYVYILILPCVLLTTLTLVLYWIPPESPTKMSLGMSIYMAFFVLLLMFEANMPPASDGVPILGTYYCLNMILITCSTFLNVFVVNLSYYGARSPVPKLLRNVMFRFFARGMCMDNLVRPFLEADKKRLIPPAIPGMGMANGDSKFPRCWRSSCEVLSLKKDQIEPNQQLVEIDIKLTEIREFLSVYRDRLEAKDKNEKIAKEWKALGLIFDRLFFWIYLMTILVSLTVVMSFIFAGE
ncbi:neuronal acetylcholine receptor subunit alpha-10-like isoform X2 [Ruditapes philippinarum]|uniref:neuronal acetylcholine receptor subunit alpha-10-like isoform X2 n=1 Tax=Ruditapes philippinarum TaxID=129788 RepID=UPI00295B1F9F|nr:neuronal acetylcholine receptor subunit alpha-10-like isoform X2 [Ruditapes philippinarum]